MFCFSCNSCDNEWELPVAPVALLLLIRCYLTYWKQRVAVIFIGVDGVIVTVAADCLPLDFVQGPLGEAGVDPGVVGVDGAGLPGLPPPRPRHEVSEGRVLADVRLLLTTRPMRHVAPPTGHV